jgi:acyl carrier protein
MNNLLSEKDTRAVLDILVEQLGMQESQLTPDADLQEDLAADSLMLIEITMALEGHFDIAIPDSETERIRTVGDIFEVLGERLQNRGHRSV